MTNSIDVRRQSLATKAKWGLGLAGAVVASPFIFLAVKGIIGLAIAFVVGSAAINFAPVVSMKLANWKLKAITAEATANPIETLENLYIDKRKQLGEANARIVAFEAEIGKYDDRLNTFCIKHPEQAPKYKEISVKMHQGLTIMKTKRDEAKSSIEDLASRIDTAKDIYQMALAAQSVTQLSGDAEAVVFAEIKEKVAFDAVSVSMNTAFAQLNLAIESQELPALGGAA